MENYFHKIGDINRGRLRILKFQAKFRWVLSCDHWPYSVDLSSIRFCSGKDQQGWTLFCKMLEKFVEKMDYVRWYSSNISSLPSLQMVEKISYVGKAKSGSFKLPAPRSGKMEVSQDFSQKRKLQAASQPYCPKQKQWLIKNHEVANVNFENLWIISKLLASDDWRLIHKRMDEFFQTKIVINPLFDENTLISIDQGSIIDFIHEEGKWQARESFHLKFERWDNIKHSRPLF